jgi:hypothetical protein
MRMKAASQQPPVASPDLRGARWRLTAGRFCYSSTAFTWRPR